jgi:hypothetical protein
MDFAELLHCIISNRGRLGGETALIYSTCWNNGFLVVRVKLLQNISHSEQCYNHSEIVICRASCTQKIA